jgi:hypothetical protein
VQCHSGHHALTCGTHIQALPLALANAFEPDVNEARRVSGDPGFEDPTVAACTALCLFDDWYSSARCIPASPLIGCKWHVCAHWLPDRRRPQSAATAQLQIDNAQRLAAALEAFYPERDWRAVIKYHMMCHHVHIVGAVAGEWQRINTEAYELANREEKSVAASRTNRKDIDRQIIQRSKEAMAADHARWTLLIQSSRRDSDSGAAQVETLEEKREAARNDGRALGFEDTNALQFPIHELLEREFLTSSSCALIVPHHV